MGRWTPPFILLGFAVAEFLVTAPFSAWGPCGPANVVAFFPCLGFLLAPISLVWPGVVAFAGRRG